MIEYFNCDKDVRRHVNPAKSQIRLRVLIRSCILEFIFYHKSTRMGLLKMYECDSRPEQPLRVSHDKYADSSIFAYVKVQINKNYNESKNLY